MKQMFTLLTMLLLLSVTAKAQIVEKPAGEEKLYVRTGSAFAPEEGSTDIKTHTQTGKAARMVYDSDGTTVYISCPVSMFPDPVWVKGTLSDDKSTVSVALGQVLRHDAKHNTDLVLAVLNSKEVTSGGDTYLEYTRDASATTVEYSVLGNTINLLGSSQDRLLGVVYADNGQWTGYGDFNTVYTAIDDDLVTLPAEVTTSTFTLYATDGDKGIHRSLKVGFTDTDVYIQGLSKLLPEAWAKGTFNDNKRLVTFPVQFLGLTDTDYPVYICRYAGGESIDELVLVYDSDANNFYISKRDEPIMLENASKTTAGYFYKYENLTAAFGEDVAVAPADDAAKSQYMLKSISYSGESSQMVNVLMQDDKVYVQGLSSQLPDSWVVGTKTADGYELASPQYLGCDDSGKAYFFIAESGEAIASKCVLTFDAATSTFSTQTTCGVSTDRVKVRDVITFFGFDLVPFKEATGAVPADPTIDDIYPGDCELDYTVEAVSTDGSDLDLSKLSVVFYSDIEGTIEPITFMPSDYPEFSEATTKVPLSTDSDNFGDGWMIYPENDAYNRLGVQVVYTTADGETRSNIVWTKLKDYATGLSSVLSDTSASRRFFMLNGVETKSPSGKIIVVKSGTKVRKMVVR